MNNAEIPTCSCMTMCVVSTLTWIFHILLCHSIRWICVAQNWIIVILEQQLHQRRPTGKLTYSYRYNIFIGIKTLLSFHFVDRKFGKKFKFRVLLQLLYFIFLIFGGRLYGSNLEVKTLFILNSLNLCIVLLAASALSVRSSWCVHWCHSPITTFPSPLCSLDQVWSSRVTSRGAATPMQAKWIKLDVN